MNLKIILFLISSFLSLIITAQIQVDTAQLDQLLILDKVYTQDSVPFTGTAIRNYEGDYKSKRQNGVWNFKAGILHGEVKNNQGSFWFKNGIPEGNCTLSSPNLELIWNNGLLASAETDMTDTMRIKWGAKKFYSRKKEIVKQMCGSDYKVIVATFRPTNPNAYYIIRSRNKKAKKVFVQEGAYINGLEEGRWLHYSLGRSISKEIFFHNGKKLFQTSYNLAGEPIHILNYMHFNKLGYYSFNNIDDR